jgi:hypothetical protein
MAWRLKVNPIYADSVTENPADRVVPSSPCLPGRRRLESCEQRIALARVVSRLMFLCFASAAEVLTNVDVAAMVNARVPRDVNLQEDYRCQRRLSVGCRGPDCTDPGRSIGRLDSGDGGKKSEQTKPRRSGQRQFQFYTKYTPFIIGPPPWQQPRAVRLCGAPDRAERY